MKKRAYDCAYGCSVEATLDVISGKWKGVLLFHLLNGPKRFSELQRIWKVRTRGHSRPSSLLR